MVREDGGLGSISLDGDEERALVGLNPLLPHRAVVPRQVPQRRELQLDVLQLDVVHAVRRHRAVLARNKMDINYCVIASRS